MIRVFARFGLLAMVPAALNVSAAAGATIRMPICTGDGQVRMVEVPAGTPTGPGDEPAQCCVKGCHGGSSRKKLAKQIDPSQ